MGLSNGVNLDFHVALVTEQLAEPEMVTDSLLKKPSKKEKSKNVKTTVRTERIF